MFQEKVDTLLSLPPYSLSLEEKETYLLPIIKAQITSAAKNNPSIKSWFKKDKVSIPQIKTLESIPYVPVQMFKHFTLDTLPKKEISRIVKSSGTTSGVVSQVPLSAQTSKNQMRSLQKTLSNYLGNKRRIFVVIDEPGMNQSLEAITARTAGIRGLSLFAKKIFYILKQTPEGLLINYQVLEQIKQLPKDSQVYIFGFTYIIWSILAKQLGDKTIPIGNNKTQLFHSGGWKKLTDQKVKKSIFDKTLAKIFTIKPQQIHDFYGMAEQTGVIFVDCEYGYKHVPVVSRVIMRHPLTLKPQPLGKTGIIEVMSMLADSYYSQAILTEDKGTMIGVDDCKCGRKGEYFVFNARMDKTEVRGCGDTFKEKK